MWNEKLVSVLLNLGFEQSKCDHSMFTMTKDSSFTILLVYVDDIIITGNCSKQVNEIKLLLKSKFSIKDLGKLQYFLGLEVVRNAAGLCLTQRKYCLDLLAEFGMTGCKPVSCPIEPNHVLTHLCEKDNQLLTNITVYQKLVGKLIYLSHTRPDIAYSVHYLSQFMHSPTQAHFKIALRLLRYLKGAPGKGIQFQRGDSLGLRAFSDSDWAKCLGSRKSITGFCVFLGNNLVSWKSKKQSTVSRSSAEAEYRSMCAATCEVMWISNLLKELKVDVNLPILLFCDNTAAISIAANPVFHERTKHFEIDLYFLREKISKGVIQTMGIKSEDQAADIFNKGLSASPHEKVCSLLNMFDCFKY
ncbi:uncharacterized mitochondrial protein AtMg00810-like [Helianthus annuus]|uniref:uncharacterized mitochondrial protein AtMg00810-like n=1 Tax=Helianthus annuus TaxID=4232 RepID=UPI000B8F74A3|nr:uncharacterized mitochondrial protein AtMg00810-like [Helianthus annuus]